MYSKLVMSEVATFCYVELCSRVYDVTVPSLDAVMSLNQFVQAKGPFAQIIIGTGFPP